MYVQKKYDSTVPVGTPVVTTNDGNVNTGITSARWRGVQPNFANGATGNAAAGTGATYDNSVSEIIGTGNIISKFFSRLFNQTFTAGQVNYISIPISQLGYNDPREIKGVQVVGIEDPAPAVGANPTPRLIDVGSKILWHLTDDKLSFVLPAANIALLQNKRLNFTVLSINIRSI